MLDTIYLIREAEFKISEKRAKIKKIDSLKNIQKALNRVGFLDLTPEERIHKIFEMDHEALKRFITFISNIFNKSFYRNKNYFRGGTMTVGPVNGIDGIGLNEPFELVYNIIQDYKNSKENRKKETRQETFAMMLFSAVIFSHYLEDFNGHTARTLVQLIINDNLTDFISQRKGEYDLMVDTISVSAYNQVAIKHINRQISVENLSTLRECLIFGAYVNNKLIASAGAINIIKLIAWSKVLNIKDNSILKEIPNFKNVKPDLLEEYIKIFNQLNKEYIETTMRIVTCPEVQEFLPVREFLENAKK